MKRLFLFVTALLTLSGTWSFAALCAPCKDRSYTKDIGTCKECGGMTTSGQFQLCLGCSTKLHQCEHCRIDLQAPEPIDPQQDRVYTSGRWEYRYTVSNRGSRSEGHTGQLLYDGQPIAAPAALNDHHQTPWGALYWVGQPIVAFGGHGWMPKPLPSTKIGRQLPVPESSAETVNPPAPRI